MKRNYLFLAEGFEEIEALTVVDVMRRAGLETLTVSVDDSQQVTGAHGIPVEADLLFTEVDFSDADWLIMPGGMPGAANLADTPALCDLIKTHFADGGNVAAICAAPAVVLAPLGILNGRKATSYPGFEGACVKGGAEMLDTRVVNDGNLITANGPASAMPFALAIAEAAAGSDTAAQVAAGMLV